MLNFDDTFRVSFFQRLGDEIQLHSNEIESVEYVIASVKRNVSGLLNTRVGESQSCPELGLFDFNDASSGSFDLGIKIRDGIKECLERFEPRLFNLNICVLHDSNCPFSLQFQLHAQINVKSTQKKIEIDLFLDSNRIYRVS